MRHAVNLIPAFVLLVAAVVSGVRIERLRRKVEMSESRVSETDPQ